MKDRSAKISTSVVYPLVVATGLAIDSGKWTWPTFAAGVVIGLSSAIVFVLYLLELATSCLVSESSLIASAPLLERGR